MEILKQYENINSHDGVNAIHENLYRWTKSTKRQAVLIKALQKAVDLFTHNYHYKGEKDLDRCELCKIESILLDGVK